MTTMTDIASFYAALYPATAGAPRPGGLITSAMVPAHPWIAVTRRFEQLHANLALTPFQTVDARTKRDGVVGCLNRRYYGAASGSDNSFLIGSWGKGTATRPPRDVDLYFLLPNDVFYRLQNHVGNRQSALLQEVKGVLAGTYWDTEMHGDGQIILVGFESYSVEVVPAFLLDNGRYAICNTNDGGSWKQTAPWAEVEHIDAVDNTNNGNLRPLIRMLKAWQVNCSVPIKSFELELLAAAFIAQSPWRLKTFFYFDWITRDFFAYLYSQANRLVFVPGTLEPIWLGSDWQSRALTAWQRASKACDHEQYNIVEAAGEEWQQIFGKDVPRSI